jgi:hypothetical protein
MHIPETYVLNKFYAYSGEPEFKKYDNVYNAGCPICREGKSWGRKKRLFYYPTTNTFYCFNCGHSWTALNWITEVCKLTREEIFSEIIENRSDFDITDKISCKKLHKKPSPSLPYDSINCFDKTQKDFYQNNFYFKKALEYIKKRKLDIAVNKCSNLYISLTDIVHKNRICIPFQNRKGEVVFYQTRCLDDSIPRYLGKLKYDKTLFGIDKITENIDYIFIFEGPIDAMFVKNGIAAAGLNLTNTQTTQLSEFPFHKKIWILDNPKYDQTANRKTLEMLNKGYNIFKWPETMDYKDFNEMAVKENLTEIDYNIILENLY